MKYFLLFMITFHSYAQNTDNRRESLMKIIDEEVKELNRLSRQNKKYNPELQFRKAEVTLEKGRLIKEGENEDYLNIAPTYRAKVVKKNYFRQSYRYFLQSKKLAESIPKKDEKYKRKPELFYILGFYEKEFGKEVNAIEYFEKAEKSSKQGTDFNFRCKSALAEIYFNQRKYSDSKKYYEITLKRLDDKWWTKDAYNLAWSYQKTKDYRLAIETMKKVISKSQTGQYVDMSPFAFKDIGLFYAESGRISEGVSYFKAQNRDVVIELLTIATFLKDQGNYLQSHAVYEEALKTTQDAAAQTKIYLEKLYLADKFVRQEQHLRDSKKMEGLWLEKALSSEQSKSYILQMKKQVGLIQKKMEKKTYKNDQGMLRDLAKMAEDYFGLLGRIDEKNADEYLFYNAESQFQAKQYDKAAELYKKSFDQAKSKNNLKMM